MEGSFTGFELFQFLDEFINLLRHFWVLNLKQEQQTSAAWSGFYTVSGVSLFAIFYQRHAVTCSKLKTRAPHSRCQRSAVGAVLNK
ncbi:hypothetical protein DPMN_078491 [Dreissena polymorpha]|uniref:Uncharacterized protein n=1 Tax=Dreissena polymorpha TaxID=45954 RepID=A0A9D4BHJ5_DREPO|nr:hypothetical protein DPMN_078491 [Dreissena polymorpha]